MGKSKSGGLARLPKGQKCSFLIGPVSSWFMSNTTDIWTQPNEAESFVDDKSISQVNTCDQMECDKNTIKSINSLSYFAYGSIGCICYGEIYHLRNQPTINDEYQTLNNQKQSSPLISGVVNRLIDINDDNSRVSCIRFLKQSVHPIFIALTESGTLLLHDCLKSENIMQLKKTEIMTKFVGVSSNEQSFNSEQSTKRAKFGVTQQINSVSWPDANNIFLGISMIKAKTCFLLWIKLNHHDQLPSHSSTIESFERIELDLQHHANPICLIDAKLLTENICLIAVAMDDGVIVVIVLDLSSGKIKRNIKLTRHNDQICALSICVANQKKFPLGLLASVSRDGLTLVWDVENEFYFADYMAVIETGGARNGARINWFALAFVNSPETKRSYLAISNTESGLTMLELPDNARSKIRLKQIVKQNDQATTIKHIALIFNIGYDPITNTLITSSLDGNLIFWHLEKPKQCLQAKAQYLIPAMLNNSRVHMIRSNPINEELTCLALGKAGLKFFKISKNINASRFDMSPSCSTIVRKLSKANVSPTSIAWHPAHEYRLAIGTLEGKVYRADITPRKAALTEVEYQILQKPSDSNESGDLFGVEYNPIERKSENVGPNQKNAKTDGIYSLCWGPSPASPQDLTRFAIYVVGSMSHRMSIYYSNKETSDKLTDYLQEFQDTSLPEAKMQATEVAWKPTWDLMALGTIDGRVLILKYLEDSHEDRSNHKLFTKVLVIEGPFNSVFIQCLAWHPTVDPNDKRYYWLAISSNESPVFVFSLRESILIEEVKSQLKFQGDNSKEQLVPTTLSAYITKLDGHDKPVSDIMWSVHKPDNIATTSFDRACCTWSLDDSFMDARLLSKFVGRDRLFTLDWSLVDDDLILTSGHDGTIWAWRPSENQIRSN